MIMIPRSYGSLLWDLLVHLLICYLFIPRIFKKKKKQFAMKDGHVTVTLKSELKINKACLKDKE